jgi:hypothetical protein
MLEISTSETEPAFPNPANFPIYTFWEARGFDCAMIDMLSIAKRMNKIVDIINFIFIEKYLS